MKFAIAGAGLSGAVLAQELAKAGHAIEVFEQRNHIAGNCHTLRDSATGILLHQYGPHIFHTDNERVWKYVNQYGKFIPFINRVKTTCRGRVFSLPINLHTINQYFDKAFSPEQAKEFINKISDKSIREPLSFEDQALKFVGTELYETFFKGYTSKQWGINPAELSASILKRLPIRFNYDDNYFNHKYQGIPLNGYTPIVEKLLNNSNIRIHLEKSFSQKLKSQFDHIFFTGPIDAWFEHCYGRLNYRTLDFVKETHQGDYQGCAVMNYGDESTPFTRISEHKHFAPWEQHDQTVIFKEYSRACGEQDIPYYPIRLTTDKTLLNTYLSAAKGQQRVSFLGRLGTYRYLDMDITIEETLKAAEQVLVAVAKHQEIPPFFIDPS